MDTSWVENERGEFPGGPAKGCMYRPCDTAGEKISDKISDKAGQKPDGKAAGRGRFCGPVWRIAGKAVSTRRAGRAGSERGLWPVAENVGLRPFAQGSGDFSYPFVKPMTDLRALPRRSR
ncbi:hypothetical protein [Rhodovulum sulfidophilum]|uniref:hypothetical protein n=1 Tax=Rhodovulum sulfidophilum TaxID=35806 RepID=UPI00117B9240|nr:hypothetical protein [Rhodovulum sulfidophilum]MBL3553428.1 hypothetical protein [Rhodovulum sulfidophilum]